LIACQVTLSNKTIRRGDQFGIYLTIRNGFDKNIEVVNSELTCPMGFNRVKQGKDSLGADVTAIHVVDRSSLASASDLGGLLGYYEGGNLEYYEEQLRKHARELLGEAEGLAKKEGVKINTQVIMNAPSTAEGIINYASSANVDLIVIGTKGMTGAKKFFMGSVTNKVASHAHCPVLAVR
jgi:nucleotide-binding universal stress UspA family protein